MPLDSRPESPAESLLFEARRELAGRLSLGPGNLRWDIGKRLSRKRSTLFHLTLRSATGEAIATAYYKAPYFPDEHNRTRRNRERMRVALENSRSLGDRFAQMAEDSGISVNVTLALNLETLDVVTLGLEGQPMGNPLAHAISKNRRTQAVETCFRVGAAARLMEQLPTPEPGAARERIWGEAERKLDAAASIIPAEDLGRLEELLQELLAGAFDQPRPVTLAHGDLSTSNVVMLPGRTGLIDFTWIPQLQGFDLARFVHRLRYATVSYGPWTSALIEATLEGYGDPSAPERSGWRFTSLQRLLATALRQPSQPQRRSVRRAVAEIRSSF